MLKHCSPSSVDLRRRSRRNLLSIIDNVNENEDCDTSTSSADQIFKHVIEDLTEEELDLCEDVVSVRSFSSHSSGNRGDSGSNPVLGNSGGSGGSGIRNSSSTVLPKSRIVPREPSTIPLKVYARWVICAFYNGCVYGHFLEFLEFALKCPQRTVLSSLVM